MKNNSKICITSRRRSRNWQNTGTRWPDCSGAGARTCTGSDWKKGKRKIQKSHYESSFQSYKKKICFNNLIKNPLSRFHEITIQQFGPGAAWIGNFWLTHPNLKRKHSTVTLKISVRSTVLLFYKPQKISMKQQDDASKISKIYFRTHLDSVSL
jgi:hypothetical protein